jgi:hypothetical protein
MNMDPLSFVCLGAPGQVVGGWQASVPNTDVVYYFAGATLDDQLQSMRLFATAMNDGAGAVNEVVLDTFVGLPEGMEAEELTDMLFDTTNSLFLSGGEIYLAPEEEVLLECITSAGAELLFALAAL